MDVFEAMQTCRAMRYLESRPVPEELIRKVIHAATCASNPGNSQGWDFVVLRDAERKRRIGEAIRAVVEPTVSSFEASETDPVTRRVYAGVHHLMEHFADVPVYVLVCGRLVYPPGAPTEDMVSAALYPAAQNLIVAARASGLGTTFTTFHTMAETVVREALEIPEDVRIGVMVAMGWPARAFGPVKRKPVDEVLHWDRW